MSLILAGDVVLTTVLTLVADAVGRRKTLLLGSGLMIISAACFVAFDHYWILLLASTVGSTVKRRRARALQSDRGEHIVGINKWGRRDEK
jgi:chromate transport protein ChrA